LAEGAKQHKMTMQTKNVSRKRAVPMISQSNPTGKRRLNYVRARAELRFRLAARPLWAGRRRKFRGSL